MHARVIHAIVSDLAEAKRGLDEEDIRSLKGAPGFVGAYFVAIDDSHGISIEVFETEKQAREIIKTWIKSGTLFQEDYEDPDQRKTRVGLRMAHLAQRELVRDVLEIRLGIDSLPRLEIDQRQHAAHVRQQIHCAGILMGARPDHLLRTALGLKQQPP